MPNLPMQVGCGMSGIAAGPHAQAADTQFAAALMGSAGQTIVVDESLLDAVTAVSGSGPGYVFYFAEAMERAAQELGLGEHARLLVRQTLLGAAHLLEESGLSPAELRAKVTSRGGTTHAGVLHLEARKVGPAIVDAVKAAERRSRELG
jgi:pyrroline-5-carboxylate reductase